MNAPKWAKTALAAAVMNVVVAVVVPMLADLLGLSEVDGYLGETLAMIAHHRATLVSSSVLVALLVLGSNRVSKML